MSINKFKLVLFIPCLTLCFIASQKTSYAEEPTKCSSYNAVYKPQKTSRDWQYYRMTISQDEDDAYTFINRASIITVTKYKDDMKSMDYRLKLWFVCTGSSLPMCSIQVKRSTGEPIIITPQALTRDFNPTFFVSTTSAPYALIFGNADTEFHYKGRNFSDKNVEFFGKQKTVFSFPTVWIFSGCNN